MTLLYSDGSFVDRPSPSVKGVVFTDRSNPGLLFFDVGDQHIEVGKHYGYWYTQVDYVIGSSPVGRRDRVIEVEVPRYYPVTITMPSDHSEGDEYIIRRKDTLLTDMLTVDGNGSLINGSTTMSVVPLEHVVIVSDGTNWYTP